MTTTTTSTSAANSGASPFAGPPLMGNLPSSVSVTLMANGPTIAAAGSDLTATSASLQSLPAVPGSRMSTFFVNPFGMPHPPLPKAIAGPPVLQAHPRWTMTTFATGVGDAREAMADAFTQAQEGRVTVIPLPLTDTPIPVTNSWLLPTDLFTNEPGVRDNKLGAGVALIAGKVHTITIAWLTFMENGITWVTKGLDTAVSYLSGRVFGDRHAAVTPLQIFASRIGVALFKAPFRLIFGAIRAVLTTALFVVTYAAHLAVAVIAAVLLFGVLPIIILAAGGVAIAVILGVGIPIMLLVSLLNAIPALWNNYSPGRNVLYAMRYGIVKSLEETLRAIDTILNKPSHSWTDPLASLKACAEKQKAQIFEHPHTNEARERRRAELAGGVTPLPSPYQLDSTVALPLVAASLISSSKHAPAGTRTTMVAVSAFAVPGSGNA